MAHYTLYWSHTPYAELFDSLGGAALEHIGGDTLNRVSSGDVLWLVTLLDKRLLLVGRVQVGRLLTQAEAIEVLEDIPWEAAYHALAEPGSESPLAEVDITDQAGELRFLGERERLPRSFSSQDLNGLQQITIDTAALLARLSSRAAPQASPERAVERAPAALLEAQGFRCLVSGCDVEAVLETTRDGKLLLRSDLRTLYDRGWLTIDGGKVALGSELRGTSYADLDGRALGPR